MKVAVLHTTGTHDIAKALAAGARVVGFDPTIEPKNPMDYDIIAFYGMSPGPPASVNSHVDLFYQARALGKPVVVVDYGYLGNREWKTGGRLKVSVNHWHPQNYIQKFVHPSDRFDELKLQVKPMRRGGSHILLAGIGPKSAPLYKFKHQEWDRLAVRELKKYTTRKIIYRAKPNHAEKYERIPGTVWANPSTPLSQLLEDAWAVVTHHSNVSVDGVLHGVPCFVNDGVALHAGFKDLALINEPKILSHKAQIQFLYDVAYTQWSIAEITDGKCWKHFIKEELF